jgi:hypothetical protein
MTPKKMKEMKMKEKMVGKKTKPPMKKKKK